MVDDMRRILFTISYDGTNYSGWQVQKKMDVKTVQGEFNKACSKLFKTDIESIGASRTDAGVHALGQRAVIDVVSTIPAEKMALAVNSFLPEDIVAVSAEEVETDFNPRFRALKKIYEYRIYNNSFRNPIYRNYSEFVREKLDIGKMSEASKAFIGEHDFRGFCSSGNSSKTTVREIYDLTVEQDGDFITIKVIGNGFLYNMVRIIAGTLIYVGAGRIEPSDMVDIINSGDRTKAGKTAGPKGLTLVKILY